jgi:hypothetical protein
MQRRLQKQSEIQHFLAAARYVFHEDHEWRPDGDGEKADHSALNRLELKSVRDPMVIGCRTDFAFFSTIFDAHT